VNGKHYDVEIEDAHASPALVRVNGQPFQVTLHEQKPKQADVATAPSGDPELAMDAYVPAVTATFQDVELEEEDTSSAPAQAAAEGAVTVSAPMPGTILDISVKVGDPVSQGDTLCNLEAMKMKSPIRAPEGGTVARILIAEGQNVGYGEALFTLD
jgi:biotin carboxyl carrier protein